MRKEILATCAALILCAPTVIVAAPESTPSSSSLLQRFAGTWTATPSEARLASDLDVAVWGAGASAIRKVRLVVSPAGDGEITVTRSVVDSRGRTKAASVSVEHARLSVRVPDGAQGDRVDAMVEVMDADRRYPDMPKDCWPLEGLVVKLSSPDAEGKLLNIRFDPPDGRGAFGETLSRQTASPRRTPAKR